MVVQHVPAVDDGTVSAVGHNYIGHNYTGPHHIGHPYIDHNHTGVDDIMLSAVVHYAKLVADKYLSLQLVNAEVSTALLNY